MVIYIFEIEILNQKKCKTPSLQKNVNATICIEYVFFNKNIQFLSLTGIFGLSNVYYNIKFFHLPPEDVHLMIDKRVEVLIKFFRE